MRRLIVKFDAILNSCVLVKNKLYNNSFIVFVVELCNCKGLRIHVSLVSICCKKIQRHMGGEAWHNYHG